VLVFAASYLAAPRLRLGTGDNKAGRSLRANTYPVSALDGRTAVKKELGDGSEAMDARSMQRGLVLRLSWGAGPSGCMVQHMARGRMRCPPSPTPPLSYLTPTAPLPPSLVRFSTLTLSV
jgi:hypothetical protein